LYRAEHRDTSATVNTALCISSWLATEDGAGTLLFLTF
jgi:hypothetical protein